MAYDSYEQIKKDLGEEGEEIEALFFRRLKDATRIRDLEIRLGLVENAIEDLEELVAKMAVPAMAANGD